jgi:hypothetical protein
VSVALAPMTINLDRGASRETTSETVACVVARK